MQRKSPVYVPSAVVWCNRNILDGDTTENKINTICKIFHVLVGFLRVGMKWFQAIPDINMNLQASLKACGSDFVDCESTLYWSILYNSLLKILEGRGMERGAVIVGWSKLGDIGMIRGITKPCHITARVHGYFPGTGTITWSTGTITRSNVYAESTIWCFHYQLRRHPLIIMSWWLMYRKK